MRIAMPLVLGALLCASCGTTHCPPLHKPDLRPGGVFVAYNLGCERGCDQIAKGDLIQAIDGRPVREGADFDDANLTDGRPHRLELLEGFSHDRRSVELVARPKTDMPPLVDVPPLWTVGAWELDRAPDWARRRMFGHAIPTVDLVRLDGEHKDGRSLYGRKQLVVCWDRGDRQEEGYAVAFMQVLQKARADLDEAGVDIVFAHVRFPTGSRPQLELAELRAWAERWSLELPLVPMYNAPRPIDPARDLGLERHYHVLENLGASPAILLVDARGIVRWHSEGLEMPPADAMVQQPEQHTIIAAVTFALERL